MDPRMMPPGGPQGPMPPQGPPQGGPPPGAGGGVPPQVLMALAALAAKRKPSKKHKRK